MECRIDLWRLRAVSHNSAWHCIAILGTRTGGRFHVFARFGVTS